MYTQSSDISPFFLFNYVRKNKQTTFLWVTVFMCILIFGNKFIFPDKYTSTALVQIQHNTFKTQNYNSNNRARMVREEILSNSILTRVISRLKLDKPSEFSALDMVFQLFNLDVKRKPVNKDALMRNITAAVSIDEVQANAQQLFFSVSATDNDPEFASALVNVIVEEYINSKTENKIKETSATADFLTGHLVTLEERTLDAERTLTTFKMINAQYLMSPVAVMSTKTTNKRDQFKLSSKIQELQSRLQNINLAIASTPKFNTVGNNTSTAEASPAALNQMSSSQQLAYKKNALFNLQQRYTPNHPSIKKLMRDIKMLKQSVSMIPVSNTESNIITSGISSNWLTLSREKSTIEAELTSNIAQLTILGEEVDELDVILEESPEVIEHMNNLASKVRALTKERDDIRLKQIQANIDAKSAHTYAGNDFRIVDEAQVPTLSNVASRGVMYGGGMLVSIVLGMVLVIVRGFINNFKQVDIVIEDYSKSNKFARKFNYIVTYTALLSFVVYDVITSSLIIV